MSDSQNSNSANIAAILGTVLAALLALIGVIYLANQTTPWIPIWATQTAEAKLASFAQSTASAVTPTLFQSATSVPEASRTATATPKSTPPTALPTATVRLEEKLVYIGTDKNFWLVSPDGSGKRSIDVAFADPSFRPALSPDGQSIAFTCDTGICTIGVDGKNFRRLPVGIDPSWSPDGKKIIFCFIEDPMSGTGRVATVNADGTNLIVTGMVGGFPVYSPLGTQIAYIGKGPRPNDPVGIILANLDGSNQKRLADLTMVYSYEYLSWSPDGTAIAASCTGVTPPSICVVTMDGKVTSIPTSTRYAYAPTWSPNGTHLAFFGGYVMTKDGKDVHKIIDDTDVGPSWGYAVVTEPQPGVTFQDSFSGGLLDTTKWVLANKTAGISVGNGSLQMSSQSTRYPYIYSRANPIPSSGDYRIIVRYQYLTVGKCGAPIAVTSFFLPAGLSRDETNRISANAEATGMSIWIWHDAVYFRAGSEHSDIPLAGEYTAQHEATIEYTGSRFQISIDGNRIYTSGTTNYRPRYILLGHPIDLGVGFDCPWDTLAINYVQVQPIQ